MKARNLPNACPSTCSFYVVVGKPFWRVTYLPVKTRKMMIFISFCCEFWRLWRRYQQDYAPRIWLPFSRLQSWKFSPVPHRARGRKRAIRGQILHKVFHNSRNIVYFPFIATIFEYFQRRYQKKTSDRTIAKYSGSFSALYQKLASELC